MGDKLVNEPIDERILRLLGLEDVFDLDYDTYRNLLGELVISSTIGKSKLTRDEELLIQQEFKRVKRKRGRFKPKPKKITAKSVATTKITGQKLLPGAKPTGMVTVFVSTVQSIQKSVESISKSLTEQNKIVEKNSEEERKRKESEKRKKKEESLEKGAKRIASIAKKMFAPVKGILDQIFNYLFYTFLGTAFTSAFDWFANPANKKKVDTLVGFVKDWWPSILGAAALFLTPFGAFIRGTLSLVGGFAKQIATKILPGLARFAVSNPLVTAGAVTGLSAAVGTARERGEIERIAKQQGTQAPKFGGGSVWETIGQSFNLIGSGLQGVSGGGLIDSSTGARISGAGPDTQLTALQPGEFVINRAAVRAIGVNKLMQLNAMHGGLNANKPKFAGNVQFAQGGGLIGALGKFLPGTGTVMAPLSSGPRDIRGVQQSASGYQNKLFGMNIGKPFFSNKDYSEQENRRYYERTGKYFIPTDFGPRYMQGGQGLYTPPTPTSTTRSTPRQTLNQRTSGLTGRLSQTTRIQIREVNKILGRQAATETTWGQSQQMLGDKYGWSTRDEQMRGLKKQGLIGPQSRALPSLSPSSRVRTSIITLPPSFETASGMVGKKAGTEIPSFSAIAPGNRRQQHAEIYGLVG